MELSKILIIDDTQQILDVLKDFFEFENYDVYIATSGRSGIERAIEIIPNLIICDVMMPNKNGFEVYLELKNNHITQNIPFVFLTADVNIEFRQLEYGIEKVNYILKPFHFKNVLEVVTQIINKC